MKKSILFFTSLFTILSFFSFKSPTDVETILQKSLDISQFKTVFEKDDNGEFLPLTIVSNGLLSEDIHLSYDGEDVQVISKIQKNDFQDHKYISLNGMKVKRKKSILEFSYGEKNVKVKLRKRNGEWVFNFLSIKGGGKLHVHIDSEF